MEIAADPAPDISDFAKPHAVVLAEGAATSCRRAMRAGGMLMVSLSPGIDIIVPTPAWAGMQAESQIERSRAYGLRRTICSGGFRFCKREAWLLDLASLRIWKRALRGDAAEYAGLSYILRPQTPPFTAAKAATERKNSPSADPWSRDYMVSGPCDQ